MNNDVVDYDKIILFEVKVCSVPAQEYVLVTLTCLCETYHVTQGLDLKIMYTCIDNGDSLVCSKSLFACSLCNELSLMHMHNQPSKCTSALLSISHCVHVPQAICVCDLYIYDAIL